jgi:hypothetical protein
MISRRFYQALEYGGRRAGGGNWKFERVMTGRGKKSLEQLLELTAEWGRGKQERDGEREVCRS